MKLLVRSWRLMTEKLKEELIKLREGLRQMMKKARVFCRSESRFDMMCCVKCGVPVSLAPHTLMLIMLINHVRCY